MRTLCALACCLALALTCSNAIAESLILPGVLDLPVPANLTASDDCPPPQGPRATYHIIAEACYLRTAGDLTETFRQQTQTLVRSGWRYIGGESDMPMPMFAKERADGGCREILFFEIGNYWITTPGQTQQQVNYIQYEVFYDPECAGSVAP